MRTPLENLQALVRGERPDRIPFTLDVGALPGFSAAVRRRFEAETGASDPAEYFDYDFRAVSAAGRFAAGDPRRLNPDAPGETVFDEWGVGHWAGGAEGTYEKLYHPLASASQVWQAEVLPVPLVDVSGLAERVAAYHARGYPVIAYGGSVYEWAWWLRGMEQFLADTLLDPDLVETIITKVSGYTRRLALETAAQGVDVLAFYDDAGTQTGMQISPDLWRRFILPAWGGVLESVRRDFPHVVFFLHSCGDITPIVPDIVALGFQILHPVQPECMDLAALMAEFSDRVVFCATVGAQRVLGFGTPDDVRAEVARLVQIAGADRRAILCPSNVIQPETPWENVLAFVEAARQAV